MLENLFGPVNNMQRALSKASERHSVLTGNLANVNTPGYRRKDVDFNITLNEEMGKTSLLDTMGQRPGSENARLDGNTVDLEKEVMAISETELRYQALSDVAASYFSGLKGVIREGK